MKKILWLASWYPDRLEPLSGDFIERHARSASLFNDITVIHIVKDYLDKTSSKQFIENIRYHPQLEVISGYYKIPSSFGFLSSFVSLAKHFLLQKKLIDQYVRQHGKPDLINVHISFKAGLGALYARWRYKLRYIVSEQWTIFCYEASPNFHDQSFVARWLMKMIYKNSYGCTTVSQYLAAAIAKRFALEMPVRIPNVVDNNLFFPSAEKEPVFTFVHVSVLNYQKSPDEIIEAIKILHRKTPAPFRFIIYGPRINTIATRISNNNLSDVIDYRSEVPQHVLAEQVRKCHTLVLYSRFETFGCVVIEAIAAGLPVIVSDIPVMRELVEEGVTGIFAPVDAPEQLAEKMLWMMENYYSFNPGVVSAAADAYSFGRVGKMFDEVYNVHERVSTTIA